MNVTAVSVHIQLYILHASCRLANAIRRRFKINIYKCHFGRIEIVDMRFDFKITSNSKFDNNKYYQNLTQSFR